MEAFVGKWTQDGNAENFEEFMKTLGVNMVLRKIGSNTKSNEEWIMEGDQITLKITSTFKNKTLTFKFGQEIDEETMDGRKVKSTFTLDGSKLIHEQKGEPHNCTIVREIQGDGLVCTSTANATPPVTSVRKYKRV